MPPAAKITIMHACPIPGHVVNPLVSGSANTIIGFLPAGRVSDTTACGAPIAMGSPTVLINNLMAARLGDPTAHGGTLITGHPNVLIGTSGQGATLKGAAASGAPFCEECEKAKAEAAKAAASAPPPADAATTAPPATTPEVEAALEQAYAKAEIAKQEIDALSDAIAAEHGGGVAKAPLKGRKRVLEKAAEYAEERGASEIGPEDIFRLKDYARNTIVVPAGSEAAALASLLEEKPNAKFKVVDGATDPCGYSGMNIAVPTASGMTAEVQINSPHMIYAKEKPEDARRILGPEVYDALASKPGMPEGGKGHELYEVYRAAGVSSEDKAKAAAESRAYYEAVRGAALGGA